MQAQGKHQQALDHVKGPGGNALVIAAERGALEGRLMVRKSPGFTQLQHLQMRPSYDRLQTGPSYDT